MSDAVWSRAILAATLLAVDPEGLAGATLRGRAGVARDAWLDRFRAMVSAEAPWRRMPPQIAEARLLGGLDLAATLSLGRPVAERGLLVESDGGVVIVPMAERLPASVAGPLAATLDTGVVATERDGVARRAASRFAVVLLDEGIDDERAPAALVERLAFVLDLDALRPSSEPGPTRDAVAAARSLLPRTTIDDTPLASLCAAAAAYGVDSLRVMSFAVRVARASAALSGRDKVTEDDVATAAGLVVAPRATRIPAASERPAEDDGEPQQEPPSDGDGGTPPDADEEHAADGAALTDRLVEAARAALPPGLLAALTAEGGVPSRQAMAGRAGVPLVSLRRGRPAGVRRGLPNRGGRLAIVETLRAAAPWQALRRAAAPAPALRVLVRREDLRIARYKQRSETTTIFVVDASGSAALNRLAEVKGAVELILADCYIRRDAVALFAFRGVAAELILPPTRSLARAKRALAGQPGGGGTPLATAIDAATALADTLRRRGVAPLVVFLTDGRGNVARSGQPGRSEAEADSLDAARCLRAAALPALLIDIAPRPQAAARHLATAMGARYQPLPFVEARTLSQAVLAASAAARPVAS